MLRKKMRQQALKRGNGGDTVRLFLLNLVWNMILTVMHLQQWPMQVNHMTITGGFKCSVMKLVLNAVIN